MSEQTASSATDTTPEQSRTWRTRLKEGFIGADFVGFVGRMIIYLILVYVLIFLFGLWRAWVDPDGSAAFFDYVRGLIDMVLSVTIITIIISIGVLIIQIARFVNLLRSEVKPITNDAKQAMQNVRATTEFIQKNAVKPVIRFQSFMAGLIAFLREVVQIARLLQRRVDEETPSDETES